MKLLHSCHNYTFS